MLQRVLLSLQSLIEEAAAPGYIECIKKEINWLKHLRDNYKKCNSRWKPSEEQAKEELLKSLQQEQPEVDLEKSRNLIRDTLNGVTRLGSLCDDQTIEHAVDNLIDELGLNARKK